MTGAKAVNHCHGALQMSENVNGISQYEGRERPSHGLALPQKIRSNAPNNPGGDRIALQQRRCSDGRLAQLAERADHTREVAGSTPAAPTIPPEQQR